MEINSPALQQPPLPSPDNGLGNTEVVLRLLTEIRDAQRESLEIARESVRKQRQARRMAIPMMIFAMILVPAIPLLTFYSVLSRPRTVPPVPTRPPIVAPR